MWELLKSLWDDPSQNYAAAYLAGRDGDSEPSKEIVAGQHYFTITLECMRLVSARQVFTKFYGVVSGRIVFDLVAGTEAITLIVSPDAIKGVEKANYGRVIVQTVPLCERIPYNGGNIELRLALLSLEATNLLTGIVDVLTSVATAAGIGYIEQAKTFVAPLEKGIDLLVQQGGCEIALYKAISDLRTGYFCVARAPGDRLVLEQCRLSPTWELIDQNGRMVVDVPYFVVRIQSHERKDNFSRIPSIRDAYAKVRDASIKGNEQAAGEAFDYFRRTVIWSPDLHPKDRKAMIESVRDNLQECFTAQRAAARKPEVVPAQRKFPKLNELAPWGSAN